MNKDIRTKLIQTSCHEIFELKKEYDIPDEAYEHLCGIVGKVIYDAFASGVSEYIRNLNEIEEGGNDEQRVSFELDKRRGDILLQTL